jgi:hypothetical protein
MMLLGTLVNVATVLTGSLVGVFANTRLPKRYVTIIFHALGVFTLVLGVSMALKTQQMLIPIFSLLLGGLLGEWWNLDGKIGHLAAWVKRKTKSGNERFTEGITTAFLLFCMGSMTILGAFAEGTAGKSDLLITKSVMDGFSSMALATALGVGVAFSVVPLFLFQGGLTLLAAWFGSLLPTATVGELTSTGGMMLVALAFSILDIKKINVVNFLPGLVVAIILSLIFQS